MTRLLKATRLLGAAAVGLSAACASLSLPAADPPAKPAEKKAEKKLGDAARLAGEYTFLSGEKGGEAIPPEHLKDNIAVFDGNTIAVIDKDRKQLYSSTYKLSKGETPKKNVWRIDMVSQLPKEGEKAAGMIKLDGDQVWLVYGLGDDRAKDFKTTGAHENLFKMKRVAKAAGK